MNVSPPTDQAEVSDPRRVDVGPVQEVVDGGAEVWFAVPAELVVVALALAFAAAVKDQRPVAVADEHAGVRLHVLRAAR
jgi:hypothetical protein